MTRLWLVRLGKHAEFEADALEHNRLTIDYAMTEDLRQAPTREAILTHVRRALPEAKPNSQGSYASQVNQFVNVMEVGDLVISPFKTTQTLGIGRITGPYAQGPRGLPVRPVTWHTTELNREAFRQDLRYSLGSVLSVCEISRNQAVQRVETVLRTGKDPGDGALPSVGPADRPTADQTDRPDTDSSETNGADSDGPGSDTSGDQLNLQDLARDQIERLIASTFTGHDLTRLVAAILTAKGYSCHVSPPGPDQGIDIVAGRGLLGFEAPRLVVQVESGAIVADQPSLQGLLGCIHDTHADQGLLVSWGGFKQTVHRRTNELFFRVRL